MKVRIKFAKTGPLQYVGHLDMLRSFQKIFKRAEVDIGYSQGFNPHQLTSFASPLGIGVTSEGEYLDADFNTIDDERIMIDRLNASMGSRFLRIVDFRVLPDDEKKAMSLVAACSYKVTLRDEVDSAKFTAMGDALESFLNQDEIRVLKKTKKSVKEMDIRPYIYKLEFGVIPFHNEADEIADNVLYGVSLPDTYDTPTFSMLLASGSETNIKPDLVLDELAKYANVSLEPVDIAIHRIDMFKRNDNDELISL